LQDLCIEIQGYSMVFYITFLDI